jgi:hypothetical protein
VGLAHNTPAENGMGAQHILDFITGINVSQQFNLMSRLPPSFRHIPEVLEIMPVKTLQRFFND